jgi:hypothetical protein
MIPAGKAWPGPGSAGSWIIRAGLPGSGTSAGSGRRSLRPSASSTTANPGALAELYAKEVLPRAKAENAKILDALNALHPYDPPAELKSALNQGPDGYRRYAQDVVRELTYLGFRDFYATLANQTLLKDSRDERAGEFWGELAGRGKPRKAGAEPISDSPKAWRLSCLLEELDLAYGLAEYGRAVELIAEIKKLETVL